MSVFARALTGLEKLHIGFHAAFARVEPMMHEMLDQAVRGTLPWHILSLDHIRERGVARAEFLRTRNVIGMEGAAGRPRPSRFLVLKQHGSLLKFPRGARNGLDRAAVCPAAIP